MRESARNRNGTGKSKEIEMQSISTVASDGVDLQSPLRSPLPSPSPNPVSWCCACDVCVCVFCFGVVVNCLFHLVSIGLVSVCSRKEDTHGPKRSCCCKRNTSMIWKTNCSPALVHHDRPPLYLPLLELRARQSGEAKTKTTENREAMTADRRAKRRTKA